MADNLAISVPIRGEDQLSPTLRQAIASLGGFDQAARQSDASRLASTERTLAAQVRATEQAAREQVRLAQDLAREQQRIAADQARATLTQARQAVQAAPGGAGRAAAQEQLRAAQDLAREQQRLATDTSRVQVRAAQDAARQQVLAARQAMREIGALRGNVGAAAGGIARGALSETVGGGLLLASGLGVAAGAAEVTRLVTGFGRESVQSFSSFERAMRETNALLGQTGTMAETTFRQMSRDVLDFSTRMGVDAVGASRALYQTISAGVPRGAEAMHVLDAAAKASIGGFTSQEVAVDGLTSVLNAYHASANQVDRINSQMFQTVNIGKVTYAQLSAGIGQVVPIAAAMGVSFAEVGAIIANSTAQGVSAGQTFDGLRQVLQAIIRPTQEARDTARLYGLEFNETAERAQGLLPFLEGITRATGGNHTALAALFGDVNALNIVLANTGMNAAGAAVGFDKITASTTAADDAAAEVDKSTSRHLETAIARWKRFQIEVGQAAAETAGSILKLSDDIEAAAIREHADPATRAGSTLRVPGALIPPAADADDPTGRIRRQEEALRAEYSRGKITVDEYREAVRQLAMERERAGAVRTGIFPGGRAASGDDNNDIRRQNLEGRAAQTSAILAAEAARAAAQEKEARAAYETGAAAIQAEHAREDAARQAQRAAQDAQDAEQAAARERQRGIEALQFAAQAAEQSVTSLRDRLAENQYALQQFLQAPVAGFKELERAIGATQTRISGFDLTIDAARVERLQARLEHRVPVLDRAAIRDATRRRALAEAQGAVLRDREALLTGDVDRERRLLTLPDELPAADILAAVGARAPAIRRDERTVHDLEQRAHVAQQALQAAQQRAAAGDLAARDRLFPLEQAAQAAARAAQDEKDRQARAKELEGRLGVPPPGAVNPYAPTGGAAFTPINPDLPRGSAALAGNTAAGPNAPRVDPTFTLDFSQTYNTPVGGPIDLDDFRRQIEAGQVKQRDAALRQAADYNAGRLSGATNTKSSMLAGAPR